jgi:hypothetical protein
MKKIVLFLSTICFMFLGFSSHAQSSTAYPGEVWQPNKIALKSTNGVYVLQYQSDGNLVIYKSGRAIWATNTDGKSPKTLNFQTDGNIVLYGYNPNVVWSPNCYGKGGSRLIMQDDGNLVIYTSNNTPIWSSGSYGK